MVDRLDLSKKRNFLVAMPHAGDAEALGREIEKHINRANIFYARDGAEALHKIGNLPPHVVILNNYLDKLKCFDLVEMILADRKLDNVTIVVLSPIPEKEFFIDDVVTGRFQFLDDWRDGDKLSKVLSRAFNFLSRSEPKEFFLKFLAPGEVLLREGEKGQFVYIVKSGELEASVDREGKKLILGKILKGEFVGEMAYINQEPRTADVAALTDCELIEIPIDHLDHVLFQKPAWSKALMLTLAKRVKEGNRGKM